MPDTTTANSAAARTETAEERTLIIERVFKASPEVVFKAWTDPAILAKWWGPEGFTTPECELDVRPGGAWRSLMVGPQGQAQAVSGVYREISPPRRLVMTWAWKQEDGSRGHETEVEISLEPAGSGTRMRLVQRLFQSREQRDNHDLGWSSSFKKLERMYA
jgi:uncharacterized protein YndB with AHSA1/START domain